MTLSVQTKAVAIAALVHSLIHREQLSSDYKDERRAIEELLRDLLEDMEAMR